MTVRPGRVGPLVFAVLVGCGDEPANTDAGNNNGDATFTALVNNIPWSGSAATTTAAGTPGGNLAVSGYSAGNPELGIGIVLQNIPGPGTYPLGVGPTVTGGRASITLGNSSWLTPFTGASGSITLITLSATRIKGTFNFSADAVGGGTPITVANGILDLPVTAPEGIEVPPQNGSRFSGTIDGGEWNAAHVAIALSAGMIGGTLNILASNTGWAIGVYVSGFTGVGTYQLGTGINRSMSAVLVLSQAAFGGSNDRASGTVVVTSSSVSRVEGSFSAVLTSATPGYGSVVLNGTFSVGLGVP